MVKIGLVGCGAIGSQLAEAIQRRFAGVARLSGLYDQDRKKAVQLGHRFKPPIPFLKPDVLVRRSSLLIEAASAGAVAEILPLAVRARKPLLVLSSGGLLRQSRWLRRAAATGSPVYVPSGAIAGLDGVQAAAAQGLRSVTLTTRKPPRAFAGVPAVAKQRIRLDKLRSPRILFEGPADKAAALFPQNINVAATLALAGIGARRTRVRIIADPGVQANIHEIEARGSSGVIQVRVENRASPANPKTSQLAIQSAVATLEKILRPVRIGT